MSMVLSMSYFTDGVAKLFSLFVKLLTTSVFNQFCFEKLLLPDAILLVKMCVFWTRGSLTACNRELLPGY